MQPQRQRLGLMLAAPSSGCGKTVLTLALLRALRNRGVSVRAAKAGPDYIDPAFHQVACGLPSLNLDPWAMSASRISNLASQGVEDCILVEAMMGLFDGAVDGSGSAADLAVGLGLPVLLVVDAAKQSHSIAALVSGFKNFNRDLKFAGVILNKVGSARHEQMLRVALGHIGVEVFGAVPRSAELELPERHLGLIQAGELGNIDDFIEAAADLVGRNCDLAGIENCFSPIGMRGEKDANQTQCLPLGQTIAIARDEAFSFIYPHLLADWQRAGATIDFFSPLADEMPRKDADTIFLPGGYPELHCGRLSNAGRFKTAMLDAANRDVLIYGECGGYMTLGDGIVDAQGDRHAMLGLLKLETSFEKRRLHLGYRQVTGLAGHFIDMKFMAHEFHYTCALKEEGTALFDVSDALGESLGACGLQSGSVHGSYMHLIDSRIS